MNNSISQNKLFKKQNGAVLMVSLMFLLIMTILGVSSIQTTVLEEKMAGNNNDYNRAFQASEAGLRAAENWLQNRSAKPAPVSNGSTGLWVLNALYDSTNDDYSEWWSQLDTHAKWGAVANIKQYTAISGVQTPPYYITEENSYIKDNLNVGQQADNTGRNLYRLTSRGTGGNDLTRVLLQTTYSKRF